MVGGMDGSGGGGVSAHVSQQMQQILSRLKSAANHDEREHIIGDLKRSPTLFSAFLRLKQNGQQQRPMQQPPPANIRQQVCPLQFNKIWHRLLQIVVSSQAYRGAGNTPTYKLPATFLRRYWVSGSTLCVNFR